MKIFLLHIYLLVGASERCVNSFFIVNLYIFCFWCDLLSLPATLPICHSLFIFSIWLQIGFVFSSKRKADRCFFSSENHFHSRQSFLHVCVSDNWKMEKVFFSSLKAENKTKSERKQTIYTNMETGDDDD